MNEPHNAFCLSKWIKIVGNGEPSSPLCSLPEILWGAIWAMNVGQHILNSTSVLSLKFHALKLGPALRS
jgi:hypothetical protein